jgi:UPF0755 protein
MAPNKPPKEPASQKRGISRSKAQRVFMMMRPVIILFVSLVIVVVGSIIVLNKMVDYAFTPVNVDDPTPVQITVKSGSGSSTIASLLYDSGLIRNKTVFKLYVDFMGKSQKLKSGTYVLAKNMDIEQITDTLIEGEPPKAVLKFTITEGTTAEGIAKLLVEKGLFKNTETILTMCQTGVDFTKYDFVNSVIELKETRKYNLEGYLFPDTYEVYVDATEETVITRLLTRFFNIYSDEYAVRAEELGMTMDEVVTLASLIEKEAKTADFAKVSAVFHNRLEDSQALESCATLQYIHGVNKLVFNEEERNVDSPYNTYRYMGLPLGPICNPGKAAIEAALYPDEQYISGGYKYFCLKDIETGELDFSKTYEEHQKKVEQYQQDWLDYQNANNLG